MKYDEKTLQALRDSIAHWKEEREKDALEEIRITGADCALCGWFREADCEGCPVKHYTKSEGCKNSPYLSALDALGWYSQDNTKRPAWIAAATKEIEFLEMLLRAGEKE